MEMKKGLAFRVPECKYGGMTTKLVQLTHGQQVVVPSFKHSAKIELVTPRGYATSNGDCPEEAEARAISHGHDLLACFQHSSIVTADYDGKAEELQAAREEWEKAQRIDQGDLVECEGRKYKVRIIGERYSDPVKFIPAN